MSQELSLQEVTPNEEIICESLEVSGDVAPESIIDAVSLKVEGTTLEDSSQYVKFAEIYTHQGNLRCHEAKVVLLEGGEIHASSVEVDTCLSGAIYAQDVTIKHLTSDVEVYASHSITIGHISGSNNKLSINYKDVPILISKIDLINDDIKELEAELQKAQKNNSSTEKDIRNEITRLQKELENIFNSAKTAKITIEKECKGTNTITFHINDTQLICAEIDAKRYEPFYLSFEDATVTLHPTQQTLTL